MTARRVLAVAAPGVAGETVRNVAAAVAGALGAAVELRPVPTPLLADGSDAARGDVLAALAAGDVAGIVVDGPVGDAGVAMNFAAAIECPVVFVPRTTAVPFALRRVLVPLDGTRQSTDAIARAARFVGDSGADVIVLHCLYEASVPRFEDRPQYDTGDWIREFTARLRGAFGKARLEVRTGSPADRAIDLCESASADLVLLGWSRHPAPSRARTVRAILERSAVPVALLPTGERDGPG